MNAFSDVPVGLRFLWNLPGFLRNPIKLEDARDTLRSRLAHREAAFLALIERAVYENAASPYRQLLALAGCERGDLEKRLREDGLEDTLRMLLTCGVYLTGDELKGHRPVVRGSARLQVDPGLLRNPSARAHLTIQTSGSVGARVSVPIDFSFVRDGAINDSLALAAAGPHRWVTAIWKVPGGDAIWSLLRWIACGAPAARWFSQVDPTTARVHPSYRWSSRVLRHASLLAGVPAPPLEYVSPDDPRPIVHWLRDGLRLGKTPLLQTFVSSAVRVCQAALDEGADVRGARFVVGGEPLTSARWEVIHRATGETPLARYATGEAGLIGSGCLNPSSPDDVHVFKDRHALVQAGASAEVKSFPAQALFVTSLLARAPLVLLNVSLGDLGSLEERACGCGLEAIGWTTHLHTVRSFEKLTAGGITFLDTDVIRILEQVLPARFGGGPSHYQLVEDQGVCGRAQLRLLVHPLVGPVDSAAMADALLAALGGGSRANRIAELYWRQAGVLHVERRAPYATASGKILHLHKDRSAAGERSKSFAARPSGRGNWRS